MLDKQWGIENIPSEKLDMFFKKIYQHSIELYRYPIELWKNGEVETDRIMIIDADSLFSDLETTFEKIVVFTGIESSESLKQQIKLQTQKQKKYKRKHEVANSENFGITKQQIYEDFSFVFENFFLR